MTLVELATTLAIALILLAMGTPSFREALESRKLDAAAAAMFTTLSLARSEAIKRKGPVVVCKSADGASCTNDGGWEQGWVTFRDSNNNALLDAGEAVIQKTGAVAPGIRFTGNLKVARYISFSGWGAPRTIDGAFQAGTLTACQHTAGASNAKQVVLSATGRVRLNKATSAECH